jgi:hypothetical protein
MTRPQDHEWQRRFDQGQAQVAMLTRAVAAAGRTRWGSPSPASPRPAPAEEQRRAARDDVHLNEQIGDDAKRTGVFAGVEVPRASNLLQHEPMEEDNTVTALLRDSGLDY